MDCLIGGEMSASSSSSYFSDFETFIYSPLKVRRCIVMLIQLQRSRSKVFTALPGLQRPSLCPSLVLHRSQIAKKSSDFSPLFTPSVWWYCIAMPQQRRANTFFRLPNASAQASPVTYLSLQQDAEISYGENETSNWQPNPRVKCTSPSSLISQVLICTSFQFFLCNLLKQVWLSLPVFLAPEIWIKTQPAVDHGRTPLFWNSGPKSWPKLFANFSKV